MHVAITGASGFIARALADHIIERGLPAPFPAVDRLTLMDIDFAEAPRAAGVHHVIGSIADPELVAGVFSVPVDVLFHLASIPAGTSEKDYDLSHRVNLDATRLLLEAGRAQVSGQAGGLPTFVFASSIAVLGGSFGAEVNDTTLPHPELTYGRQKLIGELWVEEYSRRGWIDGRTVRLAGIVARPPHRTGQLSAFMSDIIREPALGRPFVCPVSPSARCWLMSIPRAVGNLLHAATLTPDQCAATRTWTLPALHVSMAGLVDAVAEVFGTDARALVSYQPVPELEANFGRYPPLSTPAAERVGFRHDGDLKVLVSQALGLDA